MWTCVPRYRTLLTLPNQLPYNLVSGDTFRERQLLHSRSGEIKAVWHLVITSFLAEVMLMRRRHTQSEKDMNSKSFFCLIFQGIFSTFLLRLHSILCASLWAAVQVTASFAFALIFMCVCLYLTMLHMCCIAIAVPGCVQYGACVSLPSCVNRMWTHRGERTRERLFARSGTSPVGGDY